MLSSRLLLPVTLAALLLPGGNAAGQSFRRAGTEFHAKRSIELAPSADYAVVVTEFLHHGQINAQGTNVLVIGRGQEPVPTDVLQLGPGDFCRLRFQTTPGQRTYEVFYGGDPPSDPLPRWTATDGLLLETRHFKQCDLDSLDSVRDAFDSSQSYGKDYVENVHHSRNPFSLVPGPFLSCYSGYLHTAPGKYGFLTSSQDCSFLLIDGKQVVAAPGRHGPMRRAKRGSRHDVPLSAGQHEFEYFHAAAGNDAVMVAAWEVDPKDEKPQPTAIPTEAFRTQAIGRVEAGYPTLSPNRLVPDFQVELAGDVPLPDNPLALIGVRFRDLSAKAVTMGAKVQWDFGDGQTSERLNEDHVYLRPGVYTVRLAVSRGTRIVETVNRVNIDRPALTSQDRDKLHTLDDYLKVVATYDPRKLDAVALRQLVLAYEAKALALEARAEEEKQKAAEQYPGLNLDARPTINNPRLDPRPYFTSAVTAGKVAFLEASVARGDEDLYKLARLIGPMARDRLGQSQLAFDLWQAAAGRIGVDMLKAECEIQAADVAVNDLLDEAAAKRLLDAATARLGRANTGRTVGNLQRIWGDYYAKTGDTVSAVAAYRNAEKILGSEGSYIQRTARRGAHCRSCEAFIRDGQFDRAAAELRLWLGEFPADKIDGYLPLMYARYFAGRRLYAQAIAQAEQLQTVNADSPYVDQLLVLAAECEVKQGRTDRALATLHALVRAYPGSPLVEEAKRTIARLEAGQTEPPK